MVVMTVENVSIVLLIDRYSKTLLFSSSINTFVKTNVTLRAMVD